MKQAILTILFLFTAAVANAQQKEDENFSKRLFEARLAEISLRLNLSDEQKNKFAPIYEQYCHEMSELRGRSRERHRPMRPGMKPDRKPGMKPNMRPDRNERPEGPRRHAKGTNDDKADKKEKTDKQRPEGKENISDADKVKHMKERMERQKKAQEIRLNYADKFATILTDKQLLEFFEVENGIQEKLQKRAFRNRP